MFRFLVLLPLFLCTAILTAQVTCDPVFPNVDDDVTITFNAAQGNAALAGFAGPVYAHMGVITDQSTSPSDWKHVTTTWGIADAVGLMTYEAPNIWKKSFNIRTFFNIPQNETVLQMAFVFRNTSGSIVGRAAGNADMYYDVYPANVPLQTLFVQPVPSLVQTGVGQNIPVQATASTPASLKLLDNGAQVTTANGLNLQTSITAAAGLHRIDFIATTATATDTSTFHYFVPGTTITQNPPGGSEWGITRLSNTSLRLVLYAPNKSHVYAIGDFSDWLPNPAYQMKRGTDNATWWIELTNLPANETLRFQYLVDGSLRIADPFSTLVLDPANDQYIPLSTYPDLPPYPTGETSGLVTAVPPAAPPFEWQATSYARPKKTDLVVYELLLRDFLAAHDYNTLVDTLDYLERLGVTAIELMPINEFDGNISWGYNDAFHMALDKYYGTADDLKYLVDECHKRNIAVILDVVYNHITGASPLAQLYWNSNTNQPAANNPWLNVTPKHDFNVFNDMNHESQATKGYVKNCLEYWIKEFKIDGYRFDLSKGFTQTNTLGNTGAWGQYDASRVAILKDYADFIWDIDPSFYVILEHFADNTEEKELANYGMMVWGKMWENYKNIGLGFNTYVQNTTLDWVSHKARGWNDPHLIGYMESHDEDRLGFELKTYGNGTVPGYDVKSISVGMRRLEMLNNLLYTVPGPKMLWQFGEVGYDYTINYCENGSVSNDCRTSPKPIRWDYYNQPNRRRLYDVTAALLQLRKNLEVFETADYTVHTGGGAIRQNRLHDPVTGQRALVLANVNTADAAVNVDFPASGWWYEYYTGDSLQAVTGTPQAFTFAPGEYRIYLNQYVALPPGLNPTPVREAFAAVSDVTLFPNPASETSTLAFVLEEKTDLQLEVFDINGRRVSAFQTGELSAGEHQMTIPTVNFAPGFYFVRLSDAEGRGSKTVKLIRS